MLSRQHIPALDGFRAIAILLVIPHNVDVFSGPVSAIDYPAVALMHAGWTGVQLFFVLSGFLITGALLDSRGSADYFRAFFSRRVRRIMPLYFAVLTLTFVVAPAFLPLPEKLVATQHHQVWLWTFLNNWTQAFGASVHGFGHFWSLAVEEQFYLLWPFVVLFCPPVRLLWVCGATVVVALLVRAALSAAGFPHDAIYQFTVCRMDALAIGAAAAALIRIPAALDILKRSAPKVALAAALALLACAATTRAFAMYDLSTQTVGYTLLALGFGLAVLVTTVPTQGILGGVMSLLGSTPLRYIARYSYGMYVFHLPLHTFFGMAILARIAPHVTAPVAFAYVVIMTVASFALAALSYELFESRLLRPRHRLVPAGDA